MTTHPTIVMEPLIIPPAERKAEREHKLALVREFLERQSLAAVLLRRNENVTWMTCGDADTRVLLPSDTGIAALLVRRDGKGFYLAPNNEAPRLAAEDFAGGEFEPVITPWYAAGSADQIRALAGGGAVGSDTGGPQFQQVDLAPLRASLSAAEMARYRWLGRAVGAITERVLLGLEPGMSEHEMEARIAYTLLREGIAPSVLLMAVDDRIRNYKHAVADGARLQRFGMLNLCARKWGLAISITRFVHFGDMPEDLERSFAAAAQVNAALLEATRAGVRSGQLYQVAADAYRAAGFPGEEQNHHQGGAAGYREREWVAVPDGTEVVQNAQAFAWNPSIRGGKVEDTVLLLDGVMEMLTPTPGLPMVETRAGASAYASAGVLLRS